MGAALDLDSPAMGVLGAREADCQKGIIPVTLIRWEMTGHDDEIKELLAGGGGRLLIRRDA